VRLGERSYDIAIGPGLLGGLGERVAAALGETPARCLLAVDEGLPGAVIAGAQRALESAGVRPLRFGMAAAEQAKTLERLAPLLSFMAEHRLERAEPVVALGGGIVGDLAGFAAAIYRRGIPFVQCPTTLLAMVDASVGGKTGANLAGSGGELLKNMVGAFHQPRAVVIDSNALASLPDRFFRSGLAECIKHGMIAAEWNDPSLLDWTGTHMGGIVQRDPALLAELITRNVRVKAAVVERDEREERGQGGRALLNLGHTFAHAIETIPTIAPDGDPAHAPLHHGEAVALGLLAATVTAESTGRCPAGLVSRVTDLAMRAGLPSRVAGLPADNELLVRMAHDKKSRGGRLRLVLPVGLGRAAVFDDVAERDIRAGLGAIRA
jgi:3-dehydroquinate synthase